MNAGDSGQPQHLSDNPLINPKRHRSVSVSGRLRSASVLFESGKITNEDKNSMKDLILCQDPLVEQAFIEFESGDETKLLDLVKSGYLQKKSEFAFLDVNSDLGVGSLSLNPLTDDGSGSSIFAFSNGMGLDMEDSLPDELALDDIDGVNMSHNKRTRASDEYTGFRSGSVAEDPQTTKQQQDHYPSAYNTYSTPAADAGFNEENPEYMMIPSGESNYTYQSGGNVHLDSVDYGSHLDPMSLNMASQSNTMMSSMGVMDTSMLTLSATSRADDKRLPPPGLTSIDTQAESQKKYIGIYSPESRKKRVQRFFEKRKQRVWTKKVKYDVRKNFADSRLRVKGRFVKKEDEELLRELMNLT